MSETKIDIEVIPCPLGCPQNDENILTGRDLLHNLPGEFTVVKCKTCGLMRTNPRPTSKSMGFYYPDNYGPYESTIIKENQVQGTQDITWKQKIKNLVFRFNTDILPPLEPGRMLEIGSASGAFMHAMARRGWKVEGIEYSRIAAQNAIDRGYQVHIGPLETAPDPFQKYDLVVGWMVLEHLHEPVLALEKIYQWTSPDAWLVLSVPNAGSYEFNLFKDKWYALQLPTHLFHFIPKTITNVLKQTGWEVEKIHYQRNLTNFFVSTGYVLDKKLQISKFAEKLIRFPENAGRKNLYLYPMAYVLSLFGQTGRMTIWAKKRSR